MLDFYEFLNLKINNLTWEQIHTLSESKDPFSVFVNKWYNRYVLTNTFNFYIKGFERKGLIGL
jgi:hypothetical protein